MHKKDYDRLQEIYSEMNNLLEDAKNIIHKADAHVYERAKAYWINQIDLSLSNGAHDCTMENSIKELEKSVEKESDE